MFPESRGNNGGKTLPGIIEMTELTAKPKRSIATLIWLIVSQLMALASLLFWVIVAGLSVMAFDEGQSPGAWVFVLAIWTYPLFPLVMAIGAWIAFAFRKNRTAVILSGLSFAPPVLLYLIIWIGNLIGPKL
jgi:uncharacterized BrkB/YihY/UPF0761 family membrane protein